MDTMGDAEAFDDDDEAPPSRPPLVTPEALAVTSLASALSSLFVSVVGALIFLLATIGFVVTLMHDPNAGVEN
jgi:hypothetical protein